MESKPTQKFSSLNDCHKSHRNVAPQIQAENMRQKNNIYQEKIHHIMNTQKNLNRKDGASVLRSHATQTLEIQRLREKRNGRGAYGDPISCGQRQHRSEMNKPGFKTIAASVDFTASEEDTYSTHGFYHPMLHGERFYVQTELVDK